MSSFKKTLLLMIGFVTVAAVASPRLRAQGSTRPAEGRAFEVASVKPDNSGDPRMRIEAAPGRFTAAHATLRQLTGAAYRVQSRQISGGPDWFNSARFEIQARAEGHPLPDQLLSMLRTLLADRFALVLHTEKRELPIFALVVRSNGRAAPQLRRSDCDPADSAFPTNAPAPAAFDPGEKLPCGTFRVGGGRLILRGMPMSQIVRDVLTSLVNRAVVDRTGLAGIYDLSLQWTPILPPRPEGAPPPLLNGDVVDLNGPTIFEAVQDQLGLRLESMEGSVDVLVIDSVQQPTPD
jgi:uncharacterized protein (TIGR03435 family)